MSRNHQIVFSRYFVLAVLRMNDSEYSKLFRFTREDCKYGILQIAVATFIAELGLGVRLVLT